MFKYIALFAVLAVAFAEPEAKPGVVAAPVVGAPLAYTAGYAAPYAPYAYSAQYTAPVVKTAYASPYAYSAGYAPVAYSAPYVTYH